MTRHIESAALRRALKTLRPYPKVIPGAGSLDGAPLSTMQEQLWFLSNIHHSLPVYLTSQAWLIEGPLDPECLWKTFMEIVRHHEVLRSNFREAEGKPVSVLNPSEPIFREIVDVSGSPDPTSAAEQFRREFYSRSFDLSRDPMFRPALIRLGPTRHILTIVIPHAVFDGVCLSIFLPDMTRIYSAFRHGARADWPETPVQYRDFAVWNRQFVEGHKGRKQIAYWARQLRDLPSLELQTDHARPVVASMKGRAIKWEFSLELTRALEALAKSENVSVFMILVAALQIVLHRYTGQEDFAVGTMFANRARRELKRVIGMFTNEIVLRANVAGDPSFADMAKRVREVMIWASLNQDAPFAKVVETVNPARIQNRNPLFDVLIVQQKAAWEVWELEGCNVACDLPLPCDDGISEYNMAIYATEGGKQLHGSIDFATDFYEEATVRRLWEHVRVLLEAGVKNPGERISQLPVFAPRERQQLLVDWNRTEEQYPQQTLQELFEAQAELTPDKTAVIDGGRPFSFRYLNQKANQLARHLQRWGVKAEEPVGVSFERSVDLMVALLGILKAGAAWVPLDPAYPNQRLAYMQQDAGIRVHLTQEQWLPDLPRNAEKLLCLDRDWPEIEREESGNLNVRCTPDNIAYIIYTSGSTGRPKGVEGLHRGIVNRLQWMWKQFPFATDEVACARAPLNFVDSVWELFGPLLQGIPNVLIPDTAARDPQALVEMLEQAGVTRLVLVPSLLRVVLEACPDAGARLAALRVVVSSGEALPLALAERFHATFPHAKLINLYGATEVAADVTWYETKAGEETVPIGRPIANTQAFILDAQRQLALSGAKGELYIGGAGLARGYHGQSELTAERFVPNPFSNQPGALLYKTGDMARYSNDGNIQYLGRADYQVKLRGVRVEMGEVESTLSQNPLVEQSVIMAREDDPGELRLVAYVVPKDKRTAENDAQISALVRELRVRLEEHLPEYMVPSRFVVLAALPLMSNGKINRLALPDPPTLQARASKEFVEPRTEMERKLAAIWREVLRNKKIGADDNFFDSGGHSLLLVKVHAKLVLVAPRAVTVTDLFRFPTIRSLARFLSETPSEGKMLPDAQMRAARQLEALRSRKKAPSQL
jgi:amino acid adenylation domain-containing protein